MWKGLPVEGAERILPFSICHESPSPTTVNHGSPVSAVPPETDRRVREVVVGSAAGRVRVRGLLP